MKAKCNSSTVTANLQHRPGGDRDRRPSGVVLRIVVRDERAERIVAAAQIQNDQVASCPPLRASQVGEKGWRGEADGEGGNAAADELASGNRHIWCPTRVGSRPNRQSSGQDR